MITKIIHRTVAYLCFAGMVVLLFMMLLTTSDVIGRDLLTRPITGAFEIAQYMLVTIVVFGIAYAQQRGQHVRVEFFTDKLPVRVQLALDIIFTFMAFVFFSLLAWQGWELGFTAIRLKTASDLLSIPSYPFVFLVAIGAFLMTLELLIKLVSLCNRAKRHLAGGRITE